MTRKYSYEKTLVNSTKHMPQSYSTPGVGELGSLHSSSYQGYCWGIEDFPRGTNSPELSSTWAERPSTTLAKVLRRSEPIPTGGSQPVPMRQTSPRNTGRGMTECLPQ